MLRGIIFDFDGVIVDTEKKKFEDIKKILSEHNLKLKKSDFPGFIGKKTEFYLKEKFPAISKRELGQIMAKRKILQFKNLNKNKKISGINNLLKFLKANNYKIAISTGSARKFVERILCVNDLVKYIDVIIAGEDFKSSKPNPECYVLSLKKLKLDSTDVIIIEDSPAGIIAGKKVGAKVFAIQTYLRSGEISRADKIFKNHDDILGHFKNN